jgi:hypothetical protein
MSAWRRIRDVTRALREKVEARQEDLDRELRDTRASLHRIDAAARLAEHLVEARDGRYEQFHGVFHRVHQDLSLLSKHMADAQQQWRQARSPGPPPLERVILYVDDLDRCPPRTVVDVLAAVNLLLSFPLFVVVVAVDPVWLERSIVQHRRELLGDGEHDSGHGPLDYLDKIFQVPFALRPMGATGDALIDALLPPPVPEADGRAGPRGGAADDRPGPDLPPPVPAAGDERHQPDPLPTRPVAPPPLDLQPGRLYLRETEREFAKRLRPLLRTPRNVKKLVNLYRLVRIGVPDAALTEFIGTDGAGPYQAVLVLLALTVESPAAARRLFTALEETPAEPDGTGGGLRDLLARIVATPAGCDGPARELTRLARLLDAIAADRELRDDLATYRTWAGTVARFSFETYELVHETKGG